MKNYKTVIVTVNGIYDSDVEYGVSDEDVAAVEHILKNIKYADNLSIVSDGRTIYFNPDNVICGSFVEVEDEEPA